MRDHDTRIVLELKKGNTSKKKAIQQCRNYMYFLSLEGGRRIESGFVVGFPSLEERDSTAGSGAAGGTEGKGTKKANNSVWVEEVSPRKN